MIGLKNFSILRRWPLFKNSFPFFYSILPPFFLSGIILTAAVIGSAVAESRAEEAPRRIISMSPAITEILFEIGAGGLVVGVTDFCVYPPEAALLRKVGGILNPNVEAMISIQPDIIIHHFDSLKIRDYAGKLGFDSLPVKLTDLNSILDSILIIGKKLDLLDSAQIFRDKLKSQIDFYRNRLKTQRRKTVLLLLGDSDDPMLDLYAVGRNTFLGELLSLAGGNNILPETFAEYPKISKEYIIQKSPEVIIIAGPMAKLSKEKEVASIQRWAKFSTVKAVQNNNIYYIGDDYILIPGPRLLKIVDRFAKSIHPEIFFK